MRLASVVAVACIGILSGTVAASATPVMITFTGTATDSSGTPLASGGGTLTGSATLDQEGASLLPPPAFSATFSNLSGYGFTFDSITYGRSDLASVSWLPTGDAGGPAFVFISANFTGFDPIGVAEVSPTRLFLRENGSPQVQAYFTLSVSYVTADEPAGALVIGAGLLGLVGVRARSRTSRIAAA